MIPLKTLPNAKVTPYLTWFVVALNVFVFAVQMWLRFANNFDLAAGLGVVPRCLFAPDSCGIAGELATRANWLSPFYALFLHGDLLHLGFNMLFLLVFGGALEAELGRVRWLLCYFYGGMAAMLCHSIFAPGSLSPVIGASGAIAALLGAALVRMPRSWVLTYIPPLWFLPLPAPLFLVIWLAAQMSGLWGELNVGTASAGGGIAWMAHLGGFAFGALYGWQTRKKKAKAPAKVGVAG